VKKILTLLTAVVLVAAVSTSASGQVNIQASKVAFEAEVGAFDTGNVVLNPTSAYTILDAVILYNGGGAFTLVGAPTGSMPLPSAINFAIVFAPYIEGTVTATLIVKYSYMDFSTFPFTLKSGTAMRNLYGNGTITVIPPDVQIAELIDYYSDALIDGTIYGVGKGNSAGNKARALQHQLRSAQRMIDAGDYDLAIDQLNDIYKHADGADRPKDFVDGPGLAEFQTRIQDLIDALVG
jgi:hypothetical protein